MKRIRILLADDQQLFLENLRIVIESRTEDIEVVGIAANGREAIELSRLTGPDAILMDVRMPEIDGVEATRIIHQRQPDVRIIMLTTFDNDEYVYHALQYGAAGYILKNIPPEELFASVRAVHQGAVLISPSLVGRLIQPPRARGPKRVGEVENKEQALQLFRSLNEREREMISLVAMAYSNKDLADRLGIAEQTVKNYMSLIYDKLGVFRRTELMRMFRDFNAEDFQA